MLIAPFVQCFVVNKLYCGSPSSASAARQQHHRAAIVLFWHRTPPSRLDSSTLAIPASERASPARSHLPAGPQAPARKRRAHVPNLALSAVIGRALPPGVLRAAIFRSRRVCVPCLAPALLLLSAPALSLSTSVCVLSVCLSRTWRLLGGKAEPPLRSVRPLGVACFFCRSSTRGVAGSAQGLVRVWLALAAACSRAVFHHRSLRGFHIWVVDGPSPPATPAHGAARICSPDSVVVPRSARCMHCATRAWLPIACIVDVADRQMAS